MYDLDKESFGKFLAALRKEKGLTQRQLAQKLFVSDKAVSKWERGVSQSSRDEQLTLTFFPSIVQQQDRRAGTIPARRSCHVCRSEKTGG